MYATQADAHIEWHRNTGIPVGTPGCPQDACHPVDPFCWSCDDTGDLNGLTCPDCREDHSHDCPDCGQRRYCYEPRTDTCAADRFDSHYCHPDPDPWTGTEPDFDPPF